MKKGQELKEIATELERQLQSKKDYVAPSRHLEMRTNGDVKMSINGKGDFEITDIAHGQIAQRLGIPQKYYDKMRADKTAWQVLENNVNHWLKKEDDPKMLRTLDGKVRAFLSHRYRPLDNFDLASVVLPIISEAGCKIESTALTDSRLYIKALTPKTEMEIAKGDVVQAGIVISNSEIGMGSVKVEPLVFRLVCTNGMIANDSALKKYHIGRNSDIDFAEEFYRNETRQADDRAFWLKVADVVRGSFNKDIFKKIVDKMRLAKARPIEADVIDVVEKVQSTYSLQDEEKSGVLKHLINGGDLSQYGLLNAVTRQSQDVPSYDRATELERIGGQILEINDAQWKGINKN